MRILFIDVNCKNSSTGNIVYFLHSECIKHGFQSSICYGRGKKIKEKNIFKFGIDVETCLHAFLTRVTGYTGCFSFFSTARLIAYIKRFKPNVVHIHELHAYFVNVTKLLNFLKKSKIKVIFTNHCEFIYTGKCGHAKECDKYSKKCGSCPHLKDYPSSLFFDHTSHMLASKKKIFEGWKDCYFVSPSSWLNQRMDSSFLSEKKRVVIHNGIDTNMFSCGNISSESKNQIIILSVAPNIMSDLKGGERIIELASLFEQHNLKFVLVGANGAYKKPIPDNVEIKGIVSNKDELINMYRLSDVFIVSSSFENYPTTSLEAQCCGLPVCGFDVGGVKETILPGNGGVVPFGDLESMKRMILEILSKKADKLNVSNRSKNEFSNHKMFEKYLELYKKVL